MIRGHWQYWQYVWRHKRYVYRAGRKLGLGRWQLWIHDSSKFNPAEWRSYAHWFYGSHQSFTTWGAGAVAILGRWDTTEYVERRFNRAWLRHIHHNKHHWQYWLLTAADPVGFWTIQPSNDATFCRLFDGSHEAGLLTLADPGDRERIAQMVNALNRQPIALPMPVRDVKEMVADWDGAGNAMGYDTLHEWYESHKDGIVLHPDTRALVETYIAILAPRAPVLPA